MRALEALRVFHRDRRGVSAVEFAMIAPVLILIYFGMAELAQGMSAQRRVSHSASAIGDLIAQKDGVLSNADRDDVFAAASNIVKPFPTGELKLRVTSVSGNAKGQPRVDWSEVSGGLSAYGRCAEFPGFPTGLITIKDESVIVAEAEYKYTSPVASVLPSALSFKEKFYLRPRRQAKIPREGVATTPAC